MCTIRWRENHWPADQFRIAICFRSTVIYTRVTVKKLKYLPCDWTSRTVTQDAI